jgi:hypothetical protein
LPQLSSGPLASNCKAMDKDIDIYEYQWWPSLIGHVLYLIVSIASIYAWFIFHGLVHSTFASFCCALIFLYPPVWSFFLLPNMIRLFSTPKTIFFKENSILVISPFNQETAFSYEDISRLVISRRDKSFKATLYFANDTKRVIFAQYQIPNFSNVLQTIRKKGLGHVIEQQW